MTISCSSFNPYEYRETIEDAMRFEMACELLRRTIKLNYSQQFNETMTFVHQAKTIHKYPTYYETLQMLKLGINNYTLDREEAKLYVNIIEILIVRYNESNVDLGEGFTRKFR